MKSFDHTLSKLASELIDELRSMQYRVVSIESCTGGGIAHAITAVPGSSACFEYGFVTYGNQAKIEMVGVPSELISMHGAVSEPVAVAMAEGGIRIAKADCSIAVTGIAGPDGGTITKPVGTVCFAWSGRRWETVSEQQHFIGSRHHIREQSMVHALTRLLALLRNEVDNQRAPTTTNYL